MREIVGAMIGTTITNNVKAIILAVEHVPKKVKFLDKEHMKFMSACDLGINWDNMANSPVLFVIEDNGTLTNVKKDKT